mmetsp:Transcript_18464/g.20941  ORF Transcript_18464/g.20941 Transcript_18464/m.20941 type:complete len:218 (+) Transcript_18464:82-735(+)
MEHTQGCPVLKNNPLGYVPKAYVGRTAPAFGGQAWDFSKKKIIDLKSENFKGKYVVLFFYPLDFTFVCPTEITDFQDNLALFNELDTVIIGASVDSVFSHREWTLKDRKTGGLGALDFPLLSDINKTVAKDFGVLNEDGVALRATFIIDREGKLKHASINDLNVGRNIGETVRLIKAFQYSDQYGDVCPAKWEPGKPTMEGTHDSDKTKTYFDKHMA